ncbi:MAG: hypothetical protein K0Q72_4350 [Armatimonadetes bacterium]|nr:hypothetical protein [Armatimonadota bacterium]
MPAGVLSASRRLSITCFQTIGSAQIRLTQPVPGFISRPGLMPGMVRY